MKIYISSTFSDLREYRKEAELGIQRMGFEYNPDYFNDSVSSSVQKCLEAVQVFDVFILIIGYRYGFIPKNKEVSLPQLEYETAVRAGKPILAFFLSEDVPVPVSSIDIDPVSRSRLQRFKNEVAQNRVIAIINSPEDLASQLVSNLHRLSAQLPGKGRPTRSEDQDEITYYKNRVEELNQKLKNIVPADPIWRGRNFSQDDLSCFVLMPLQPAFIRVYETCIIPAAESVGLHTHNAKEISGNNEILEDIWKSICKARIIIADVTDRNPNVFYELGICHTLGKQCVVITQNEKDVPFDIQQRRYILYEPRNQESLKDKLMRTIKAVLTES